MADDVVAAGVHEIQRRRTRNGGRRQVPIHLVVHVLHDLVVEHKVGAGAVVQLGALMDGKVSLVAYCSPEAIKAGQAAGKLIGALATKLGGKGGGKPDYAQGGGGDASKLADALKL